MFEWSINNHHYLVRPLESMSEYHDVEEIQREAWQFSDLDIVPAATLIATGHAGGLLLGAFENETMIGFVYGFIGYEHEKASIHSHMLAVRPQHRNCQAGFYLKLAQREATLARGINEITWTYDPLQTLNAHLNFGKLGVISRRYLVNFYGEETSSPLHQGFGTDRLWVSWPLDSDRVKRRIQNQDHAVGADRFVINSTTGAPETALVFRKGDSPQADDMSRLLAADDPCFIEIPQGINEIKERQPELGPAWREMTREAFLRAIERGFVVDDFIRIGDQPARWFYVLKRE